MPRLRRSNPQDCAFENGRYRQMAAFFGQCRFAGVALCRLLSLVYIPTRAGWFAFVLATQMPIAHYY